MDLFLHLLAGGLHVVVAPRWQSVLVICLRSLHSKLYPTCKSMFSCADFMSSYRPDGGLAAASTAARLFSIVVMPALAMEMVCCSMACGMKQQEFVDTEHSRHCCFDEEFHEHRRDARLALGMVCCSMACGN